MFVLYIRKVSTFLHSKVNTFCTKIFRWSVGNRFIKRLHVHDVIFILQHFDWVVCMISECDWIIIFKVMTIYFDFHAIFPVTKILIKPKYFMQSPQSSFFIFATCMH